MKNAVSNGFDYLEYTIIKINDRRLVTYTDTDYQFRIEVPGNWTCQRYERSSKCIEILNKRPPFEEVIRFFPDREQEKFNFTPSIKIKVFNNLSTSKTFKERVDKNIGKIYSHSSFVILKLSKINHSEKEHKLIYIKNEENNKSTYRVVVYMMFKQVDNKLLCCDFYSRRKQTWIFRRSCRSSNQII